MLTEKPADKEAADQTEKSVPNPAYDAWIARDQIVLGYLLQSIGPEVLPHVHRIETAAGVWQAVEEMFASHCHTKITNLRIQLANTKKLQMSTDAFLTKMQGIVDELATAGEVITAREHVSFILASLGGSYNSLVDALSVSPTPIFLSAFHLPTLLSVKDAGASPIGHEVTVLTTQIDATRDAMIVVMIARLVKDVVVAVHRLKGAVDVAVVAVAPHHGWMSPAKSVTKKATLPKIAGGGFKTKMMPMIKKLMLGPMTLIQIGTRAVVLLITSPGSSKT
ncbi:hypothetical protein QYE76_000576 [Lolium multiflorum]|uniref:Uncharacterized protein n=1 Tax=Lolium multiflorum TaxID=4521 RepID=A0AAD8RM49_LOLMU|nr:hypothetical protein QYE76_000576 [Lolium multiflorum]